MELCVYILQWVINNIYVAVQYKFEFFSGWLRLRHQPVACKHKDGSVWDVYIVGLVRALKIWYLGVVFVQVLFTCIFYYYLLNEKKNICLMCSLSRKDLWARPRNRTEWWLFMKGWLKTQTQTMAHQSTTWWWFRNGMMSLTSNDVQNKNAALCHVTHAHDILIHPAK